MGRGEGQRREAEGGGEVAAPKPLPSQPRPRPVPAASRDELLFPLAGSSLRALPDAAPQTRKQTGLSGERHD